MRGVGLSPTRIITIGDDGLSFFLQQEKTGSKQQNLWFCAQDPVFVPLDKLLPFPSTLFAKRKGLFRTHEGTKPADDPC
ncbi:MAG: hypothetical protein CO145_03035 [Candidatus Nealsonbacteria bacterium CG_4_9_14_3_um_filter_37_13]|uniref:Uncharacterized protein n=1 Tax=Candidatus Nealsonbacteria bacterium CG_4_9_14_3_um_filter_37_13 TaxID=1974695 RepID=A0A2M7Z4A2_9BACT|nr:MAG: hypothetical protein CO145_03035 [Candidatus Nealsonbacteria bacterium CG_4_9_14_3_um_filter_37_13]